MSIETRLTKLETERRAAYIAERSAQYAAFKEWMKSNASNDECAAWDRFVLSLPIDDSRLAAIGLTRAQHDEILAEHGPVTAADQIMLDAMLWRMSPELRERLGFRISNPKDGA